MQQVVNPVQMDGEPKIVHTRRAPIKVRSGPSIVVAVPCGNKQVHTKLVCDKRDGGCGAEWGIAGKFVPNVVSVKWMLAFNDLQMPLNSNINYYFESDRLSAEARQIMTKRAIRDGADYILYWDDDVLPPILGLYTLHNFMEQNKHVGAVSGVYVSRHNPSEPIVYLEHGHGAAWNIPMGPDAEPVPILGAGAGFMLARISAIVDVIEKNKEENDGIEVPMWADEKWVPDNDRIGRANMWGHDMRFCRLLQEWGYPVYVHGGVLCGHYDLESGTTYNVPPQTVALSKPDPSVDVIMVAYNQPEFEEQTLRHIASQTNYPNYSLTMVRNTPGRSLAACWNEAIRNSSSEYICLINSDVLPAANWLSHMMRVFKLEPNAGAVAPSSNMVFMTQIDTPLERMEKDVKRVNAFAATLPDEAYTCVTLSGMCVVFPRRLWEEVGGFDERFQLYGEDTEFFWRLKNKTGKMLIWAKQAYVHHYKAQSTEKAREEGVDIDAIRKASEKLVNELTDLNITHS